MCFSANVFLKNESAALVLPEYDGLLSVITFLAALFFEILKSVCSLRASLGLYCSFRRLVFFGREEGLDRSRGFGMLLFMLLLCLQYSHISFANSSHRLLNCNQFESVENVSDHFLLKSDRVSSDCCCNVNGCEGCEVLLCMVLFIRGIVGLVCWG